MENAFTWIKELWEFCISLIPHYHHFELTDKCVTVSWGKRVKVRKPGIFWYWPPVTSVYFRPANVQTHSTDPLPTFTRDGKGVSVRCMVRFRIIDGVKAMIDTHDVEESINDEALAVLSKVVSLATLDELVDEPSKASQSLSQRLGTQLQPYGVEVLKVHLTDCVSSTTLHHLGVLPIPIPKEE